MAIAMGEDKITIQLPSIDDTEGLERFMLDLEAHRGTKGVKKLLDTLRTLCSHKELVEKQYTQAQRTADYINGMRDYSALGGKMKGLRSTARRFFDGLSPATLRRQCEVYGVVYDAYATPGERLEALVDHYMEDVAS